MEIKVDRKIYSDECISKVIYWLSNTYTIIRVMEKDGIERISFSSKNDHEAISNLEETFWEKLNDFKLRQIVEEETHDIKTILYAKAFERYLD